MELSVDVDVEPLGRGNAAMLRALFVRAHCPCFCRYWHFEGTKNDWLERCAVAPETNESEMMEAVLRHDSCGRGLLALRRGHVVAEERAVGWMKLTPRSELVKLTSQGPYRAFTVERPDLIFVIGCFLIDPVSRRRGIARRLVEAAPRFVRAWGGTAIEAYPHRVEGFAHDEAAWLGPTALFSGFEEVGGLPAYPILRQGL